MAEAAKAGGERQRNAIEGRRAGRRLRMKERDTPQKDAAGRHTRSVGSACMFSNPAPWGWFQFFYEGEAKPAHRYNAELDDAIKIQSSIE